jgi:hypothetical protein
VRQEHQTAAGLQRREVEELLKAGVAGQENSVIKDAQDRGELSVEKCCVTIKAAHRSEIAEVQDQVIARGVRVARHAPLPQVRTEVERLVCRLDPEAFNRGYRQQRDKRNVHLEPRAYGMAALRAYGPAPELRLVMEAVQAKARRRARPDGAPDPALRAQMEFDAFCETFVGPAAEAGPAAPGDPAATAGPVAAATGDDGPKPGKHQSLVSHFGNRVHILVAMDASTLAGGASTPAEILGPGSQQIPAEVARLLAADATWQALALDAGRIVGVGTAIHPPGAVPSPDQWPSEAARSNGYSPSSQVKQQVLVRDQHCVVPGCEAPPMAAEFDHIVPFDPSVPADQQSVAENLELACKLHHELKTHYGWTYDRDRDTGRTTITTPSGASVTAEPRRILSP